MLFFILLTALTESLTVIYRNISFSTSFAITIASFILFGPLNAIIILVLGFAFRIFKSIIINIGIYLTHHFMEQYLIIVYLVLPIIIW